MHERKGRLSGLNYKKFGVVPLGCLILQSALSQLLDKGVDRQSTVALRPGRLRNMLL